MKTDEQVLADSDDLEMLKRPRLWPNWPILPLKRNHTLDVACAMPRDGKIALFENINMWMFPLPDTPQPTAILTPEEVLARGWKVD